MADITRTWLIENLNPPRYIKLVVENSHPYFRQLPSNYYNKNSGIFSFILLAVVRGWNVGGIFDLSRAKTHVKANQQDTHPSLSIAMLLEKEGRQRSSDTDAAIPELVYRSKFTELKNSISILIDVYGDYLTHILLMFPTLVLRNVLNINSEPIEILKKEKQIVKIIDREYEDLVIDNLDELVKFHKAAAAYPDVKLIGEHEPLYRCLLHERIGIFPSYTSSINQKRLPKSYYKFAPVLTQLTEIGYGYRKNKKNTSPIYARLKGGKKACLEITKEQAVEILNYKMPLIEPYAGYVEADIALTAFNVQELLTKDHLLQGTTKYRLT